MTATSYITVACPRTDRYFDLDAVRTSSGTAGDPVGRGWTGGRQRQTDGSVIDVNPSHGWGARETGTTNPAGAPPLDWVHETDMTIDAVLHPPREIYEGPPMTATLLVGDVHERQTELPDHSFDLIITSPPFYGVRSYLSDDHPDKWREIGSEATPAEYLDKLFALTAEWRRLLAPHGSIAIELGDTYAGSGGAGGDYDENGLRSGQLKFRVDWSKSGILPKSLVGIPQSYMLGLIYGRNPINGNLSPAGQWRIRNLKPWIRTNPPVGALGDKERPATSYITVATLSRDRWFDLDAVRSPAWDSEPRGSRNDERFDHRGVLAAEGKSDSARHGAHPGGAPPLDWWHQTDAIIDNELRQRAGKPASNTRTRTPGHPKGGKYEGRLGECTLEAENSTVGARGHHIRRALEKAGILPAHPDALDISPRGYTGAHYAVWPPELVRQLVDEMCPRRVCTVCGEPSRRIVESESMVMQGGYGGNRHVAGKRGDNESGRSVARDRGAHQGFARQATTLGWSECGCWLGPCTTCGLTRFECRALTNFCCADCRHPERTDKWRPGRILDPFVGSGTTLAVATGMGRDAVGIDLDPRNAHLSEQRCGMFLTVDWGHLQPTTELPPDEIVQAVGEDLL